MKVCFISPNVLPVPAVKGGACETLVETIIKYNEIYNLFDITNVSIFEEKAVEKSKMYHNTDFIFIKEGKSEVCDLFFKEKDNVFYNYMENVYEKIKDLDLDLIVIEGGDLEGYKYLLEKFPHKKCVAHFHGKPVASKILDETYEHFISVSEFVSNNFLNGNWINPDRVKVVYNGIEIEKFLKRLNEEEKENIRKQYNIKKEENVVLFCGRPVKSKGIKELISAFKEIKELENSKLIIVGNSVFGNFAETEFDKELVEISKDIQDKVIFTNFIHNDDLYKIHNIADIAVVPTISEEPFGMVVVEYLASGIPLIVTKSGGMPEIVEGSGAIVINKNEKMILELTNAIDYLIENPDKRCEMSKNEEIIAEKFSGEKYYKNMYEALKSFCLKNQKED